MSDTLTDPSTEYVWELVYTTPSPNITEVHLPRQSMVDRLARWISDAMLKSLGKPAVETETVEVRIDWWKVGLTHLTVQVPPGVGLCLQDRTVRHALDMYLLHCMRPLVDMDRDPRTQEEMRLVAQAAVERFVLTVPTGESPYEEEEEE